MIHSSTILNNERTTETTLGINVQNNEYLVATSKDKYNLQQHYGVCNVVVEDCDLKDAAKDIVKMLNEMNKGIRVL